MSGYVRDEAGKLHKMSIQEERDALLAELETSRAANVKLIQLNVKLIDERDRYRAALDRIVELMDMADYEDVEQEIGDVVDAARKGKR